MHGTSPGANGRGEGDGFDGRPHRPGQHLHHSFPVHIPETDPNVQFRSRSYERTPPARCGIGTFPVLATLGEQRDAGHIVLQDHNDDVWDRTLMIREPRAGGR